MSDEVICNATNPDQLHYFMAGYELALSAGDGWFAQRLHERRRLRAFLRRGLIRLVLSGEEKKAVEAVLHNDEAAAAVVAECDKFAREAGHPLLAWLASVDWAKVLEVILAIVPLFLAKADPAAELAQQAQELGMGYEAPKSAVSPYGVPETKHE